MGLPVLFIGQIKFLRVLQEQKHDIEQKLIFDMYFRTYHPKISTFKLL